MKKRGKSMGKSLLSMFLVLTMLITSIPASVSAAAAPAKDRVGSQQSVSGSTLAEGPGKENPEEIPGFEGWANISVEKFTTGAKDYLYAPVNAPVINENGKAFKTYTPELMMTYLYGEKTVRYGMDPEQTGFNYITTGMKDAGATGGEKEGYLSNGDKGKDSKWFLAINNKIHKDPVQTQASRVRSGDVIRFLYSVDGGKDIGVVNGELAINKDALIRLITEIPTEDIGAPVPGNPMFTAYRHAQDVAKDLKATQAQVDDAETKLNRIWNGQELFPATGLTVTPDNVSLAEGQTQKFDVKVEPVHTTDHVDWKVEDPSVASFDIKTKTLTAIREGETTLTATAGSRTALVNVHVKKIRATDIVIEAGQTQLMLRKSMDLKAKVTPEDTTDKTVWSTENEKIAKVDQNGHVTPVSAGKVKITATAGLVSDTFELEVIPYEGPYVYFEYKDGRIQEINEADNSFTLSGLDEGSFKVGKLDGDKKLDWRCHGRIDYPDGTYEEHYYIQTDGRYVPHDVNTRNASVYIENGWENYTHIQDFRIHTVSSGITELKGYIGDKEVSMEEPFVTNGSAKAYVNVKGKVGDQWVHVPSQAVSFNGSTDKGHIKPDGSFSINNNELAIFEITLNENYDIKKEFAATSKNVPVESFEIKGVPERFAIDDGWEKGWISTANPNQGNRFSVTINPPYASNRELLWKSLTPEIAGYQAQHGVGIYAKKAGIAKFSVTSAGNRNLPAQEVTIEFYYRHPLEHAELDPSQKEIEIKQYETKNLNITVAPSNASEKDFIWSYSKKDIVKAKNVYYEDGTFGGYQVQGLTPGTVTVTGTPRDDTGGCEDISFTVTVKEPEAGGNTDYAALAKEGIAHGQKYLSAQIAKNGLMYGDEWGLFSLLRSGGKIDQKSADDYYASVSRKLKHPDTMRGTDLARVVLALGVIGKDPSDVDGVNVYELIYNNKVMTSGDTSNAYIWGLIGLDAFGAEVPEDAAWTREKLIKKTLSFQASNGGFGLSDNRGASFDMTGMALQALAPYNNDQYPEVQKAVKDAVAFLSDMKYLTIEGGYEYDGIGNSCTAAQAATAFTALGMDPVTDKALARGPKNLITNMLSFKDPEGGFATYSNNLVADQMGSEQVVYALEAYRRLAEGKNRLYDLTDLKKDTPDPETKPARKLTMSHEAFTMMQNATGKLYVKGGDKGETFTWTSSDPAVAAVDKNGTVRSGRDGKAVITAAAKDGIRVTCIITVDSRLKTTYTSDTDSVKLTWKKIPGVKGYDVYRYDTKTKKYRKITSLSAGKTSYTVRHSDGSKGKKLESGKAYRFAVRAFVTVNGKKVYNKTEILNTVTKPGKTVITSLKKAGSRKIKISWKKVKGVSGYRVYMKSSKKGAYKPVKDLKKSSSVKYTKAGLKKNKTYTFRVRTYKVVNGKKVYSTLSKEKKLKLK